MPRLRMGAGIKRPSPPPCHSLRQAIRDLERGTVEEVDSSGARRLLYAPGDASSATHFDQDLTRLELMMQMYCAGGHGERVLDLGANPYLLSYALTRTGVAVTAGGHPLHGPERGQEQVEVTVPGAEQVTFPLLRFNVESDSFPFADDSFDVVICGELIEHLIVGPDHMLAECARVLTRGGRFIVTTPNAVSLSRALDILRGRNLDWPFSEQGVYARHNRLYSISELQELLTGAGLGVLKSVGWTLMHPRSLYDDGPVGWLKWRIITGMQRISMRPRLACRWSDGLVILAVRVGPSRRYRPRWLFGSADTVPMVALSE